jgi:AAA15 family ATPase/GTPase
MIKRITIKNFKSIDELKLELGQFNVLIGENGSGKTNILEAIALGGAAAANKLDNEFLSSRGIRVTSPEFMRAAFSPGAKNKEIFLEFTGADDSIAHFRLKNDNKPYSKWIDAEQESVEKELLQLLKGKDKESKASGDVPGQPFFLEKQKGKLNGSILRSAASIYLPAFSGKIALSNFIIYSPENAALRVFEQEGQILPLGIKGEGLFKLIKNFLLSRNKKPVREIKENLKLFDWFEDFDLPEISAHNESVLKIKDRFLSSQLDEFDQGSSSEGFLFFLFYLCLFISKDTPEFFAVDNVEASFNPKLCVEVTRTLTRLGKKREKQVIVTTHNPLILDGINLHDPEQRLFVIKRNTHGYTIAKPITIKPETKSPAKLSEAWTRGYIGGLPKNF